MISLRSFVFVLSTLSIITLAQVSHAASMRSPIVQFEFYSKDGVPVEGVTLSGMLRFKALSTKDCSGFICLPSLPRYKTTSESGEILGQTDARGLLLVESREWTTSKLSAKDLGVLFFTNGTVGDLCQDGNSSYYQDFLDLLPQWNNTKPVARNPECTNVEALDGDEKSILIVCFSPYTKTEIESLRNKVLNGCPKK